MNASFKKAVFSFALFGSLFAHSASAEIVYNNSVNDLNTFLNSGIREVGDEIILGGSGRSLTNFTLQYTADSAGFARLRFYNNDGAAFNGYNRPGTSFFDSGLFEIDAAITGATLTFDLETNPEFALFTLPESFTWSMQFVLATGSGGVDLFDPVTVGGNYDDFWDNDGTGWTLREMTNGIPINFAARIEAVPEPSTLALGVLGFGVFGGVYAWRRIRPSRA